MKKYFGNKENCFIMLAWVLVYALDLAYMWYNNVTENLPFHWDRVFWAWTTITSFLVLFLVHHYLLVPRFFLKKRYVTYAVGLGLCISLFAVNQISHKPDHFRHGPQRHMPHSQKPRRLLAPPEVARMVIALMMIGMDLGGIAWINSMKLRRRLLLLKQQNLKQELEHLRYQINPHFFMNTLNNIHVLVDVDQERAKQAIIELSGLMRHSLYNGRESLTALQNEVTFLRQYISLMQLRFANRVELKTDLPDVSSHDIVIPPLLFATFVENAFKHGISYQTQSFIDVSLDVDREKQTIRFRCENSRNQTVSVTQDGYHGIGLSNVRKRLDLQYGDNYTLNINHDDPERFVVELNIPMHKL